MPDESRRVIPTPKKRVKKAPTGKDFSFVKSELAHLNPTRITIGGLNNSFVLDRDDKVIFAFDGTKKGLLNALENFQLNQFLEEKAEETKDIPQVDPELSALRRSVADLFK